MAHSYLTPDNVYDRYKAAKRFTEQITQPFPEYQRISRNKPKAGIDPAYPNTTDGTSASIIQKTPKRIVQQIPTGLVEGDDWLSIVAQDIYTEKILPNANEDYGLFEKSQLIIENGLSYGAACSIAPFINHDGELTPDVILPYWGDIIIPQGKKSGYSLKYLFIRSWWQEADVEALIASEKQLAAQAKKRGEKYEATWDIANLKEIKKSISLKDTQAKTPGEEDAGATQQGIEIVTGYQTGVKAEFYTFSPSNQLILRTKLNKDPRGQVPIDWFYGDIDGENPFGRSIIELIGGLQNLIDADMQMYQYNRALMLNPPVVKYGNIGDFSWRINSIIDSTQDPNGKIVPLTIDTSAIANYPQLYGLQKSQLLNLVGSPDTSISAEVGNPGFGRTPAALNQQKANISVDDNAVTKQFESWFRAWSETAINLYFGERTGKEELQLTKEAADKLRLLADKGKFDVTLLSDDDKILIDYDTATPVLKFRIDPSTSKMQDTAAQLAALKDVFDTLNKTQFLQQIVPPEKIIGAWNAYVSSTGVENPETLKIDLDEFKQQQAEAEQMAQAQAQQQAQQAQMQPQMPQEQMPQMMPEMPPQAPQMPQMQPMLPPEITPELIQELRQLGISDEQLAQAIEVYGGMNAQR